MTHVAWSCDGRKLGAVGIDKVARVWQPEKSVRPSTRAHRVLLTLGQMELRSASIFSQGHSEDVDYLAWNPTHPELFCTSSQRDRRIVFWDGRREQFSCMSSVPYSLVHFKKAVTFNKSS